MLRLFTGLTTYFFFLIIVWFSDGPKIKDINVIFNVQYVLSSRIKKWCRSNCLSVKLNILNEITSIVTVHKYDWLHHMLPLIKYIHCMVFERDAYV